MKGRTSDEVPSQGTTSHFVGALPIHKQISSGRCEPYSSLKCVLTRLSSFAMKTYESKNKNKPKKLTLCHRVQLPHHPPHDILCSLSVLPPSRNLKHKFIKGHSVWYKLFVEMTKCRQMFLKSVQTFLSLNLAKKKVFFCWVWETENGLTSTESWVCSISSIISPSSSSLSKTPARCSRSLSRLAFDVFACSLCDNPRHIIL